MYIFSIIQSPNENTIDGKTVLVMMLFDNLSNNFNFTGEVGFVKILCFNMNTVLMKKYMCYNCHDLYLILYRCLPYKEYVLGSVSLLTHIELHLVSFSHIISQHLI